LKKLAASTMSAIKAHGMTGEQPAHHSDQGAIATTQQQVKMKSYIFMGVPFCPLG
jgi:hypothetical protein